MLHGVKEGLVGLDPRRARHVDQRRARACCCDLPYDCVGPSLADLPVDEQLRDVLTGRRQGTDLVVGRRRPGARDEPQADGLPRARDRLGDDAARPHRAERAAARARRRAAGHRHPARPDARVRQPAAHHLGPGRARRVRRGGALHRRGHPRPGRAQRRGERPGSRDPSLAALLVAKASLAAERRVDLRFADGARLGRVDDDLSVDLTTVVGNLVDNALDAVASSAGTSRTSPARRVRTTGAGSRWTSVRTARTSWSWSGTAGPGWRPA